MNESSWEASRREGRKKIFAAVGVLIPVAVVGTILFLNNRDLIGKNPGDIRLEGDELQDQPAPAPAETDNAVDSSYPSGQSVASSKETAQPASAPGAKESVRDVSGEREREVSDSAQSRLGSCRDSVRSISRKSAASKKEVGYGKKEPNYCSIPFIIKLPAMGSEAERGKDIVIHISLELFFNDIEQRDIIMLHREEIKVVVARIMGKKELKSIKVRELEADLLHTLNTSLFGGKLTTVKIRNIQVDRNTGVK